MPFGGKPLKIGAEKPLTRLHEYGKIVAMEIKVATSDLVSVAQAARALGRPRSTIYRWSYANKIIGIKLGGVVFIPKSEVERLLRLKREKAMISS